MDGILASRLPLYRIADEARMKAVFTLSS